MGDIIPVFDFHNVFVQPWSEMGVSYLAIMLMGFFVTLASGLVGIYLILRRVALIGDAISHSVLPGLVIAFLLSGRMNSLVMFIGALAAGLLTTVLIEFIHKYSRVKQDSAIGISFTTLFAFGVILLSVFAGTVHLDTECVLYGEIAFIPFETPVEIFGLVLGPVSMVRMGFVALGVIALIFIFYKELLVSSFDPAMAVSLGINVRWVHYLLMSILSIVVVSAFESVGAILVVAMLILPGATAGLLCRRLPGMMWTVGIFSLSCSVLGLHLAIWLDCSIAGAMVVMAGGQFGVVWAATVIKNFARNRLSVEYSG